MTESAVKQREADLMFYDDEEDEDTQANMYLSFRIGKEMYAIGIEHIVEIVEMQKITEVPDLPEYVKGVINLRGNVIPVLDVRIRFKLQPREYDDRTCNIIINLNNTKIGLIVDTVQEALTIMPENISPPPNFKTASGKERYISGMGKVEEEVVILLNVEKILYGEELEAIESMKNDLEEKKDTKK